MTAYPPPPADSQPQGPPPPPAFAPQGAPGYASGMAPPPPPGLVPVAPAPPVAWLIPLAAVLAVIGVFTPWFRPHGSAQGRSTDFDNLYSFKDGKIGLIAPIVLVAVAVGVIGLLRGKVRGRLAGAADPVRASARYAVIAGVVSAVCLVIAWFLVTSQYSFEVDGQSYSWDKFQSLGVTLTRGPQIGYWLTVAAAVLAIVGGVLMYVLAAPAPAPAQPPGGYPPPGAAFPPPGGFPPPGNFPPPAGFAPPPSLEKPPPPSP